MTFPSAELATIASAVAVAAGLPEAALSLFENQDGSFTASVYGVEYTGTFEQVLVWAAQEARAAANRQLGVDEPEGHTLRP